MPPQRGYHTVTQMGVWTCMWIIRRLPRAMWKSPFIICTAWGEIGVQVGDMKIIESAKVRLEAPAPDLRLCKMPKGSGEVPRPLCY